MKVIEEKKRIILSLIKKEDAEDIVIGINNTDTQNLNILAGIEMTVEEERDRIQRYLASPSVRMFTIKKEIDDHIRIVGTIGLHEIDWHSKNARIGIIIFQEFQGKGFATDAVKELTKLAFVEKELVFKKLYVNVFLGNNKSQSLFYRCGFMPTGIRPAHYRLGNKYHDMVEMSILKN